MDRRIIVSILFLFFAIFCPSVFSANGTTWGKGALCGVLLTAAVVGAPALIEEDFNLAQSLNRNAQFQRSQALSSDGSLRGFISQAFGALISGPTRALLDSMSLRMRGVGHVDSIVSTFDDIALYTTLVFGLKGLQRLFFSIPHETFVENSGRSLTNNPGRVLFLDLVGVKDRLSGYAEATFHRLYSAHPDAQFIQFTNLARLHEELQQLKGKPFDRIEIMVHGKPGNILTMDADGSVVSGEAITQTIQNLGFSLSHANTELRMISCSLLNGQGIIQEYGNRFGEFLKSLLPSGGKVVGATKNIMAFEFVPDAAGYRNGTSQWLDSGMVFLAYMLNAEAYRTILTSILSLNRNYLDALNDVVILDIDQNGQIQRVE